MSNHTLYDVVRQEDNNGVRHSILFLSRKLLVKNEYDFEPVRPFLTVFAPEGLTVDLRSNLMSNVTLRKDQEMGYRLLY